MKTVLTLVAATLASAAFPAFAADPPRKSEDDRPQPPLRGIIVHTNAITPAGQTFSRPTSTISPAIPPEIPVKGGTFSRPESTFATPTGSFSRSGLSFATPAGSFSHPGPTFSTPSGSFSRPGPTFETPPGSFSRPTSTFSNPTQATSPLPPGAFGTPIRPPSTFSHLGPASTSAPTLTSEQTATPPVVIDLPPGAVVRKAAPAETAKK